MNENRDRELVFLSWSPPWPPYSGYSMRAFGLLNEISKKFNVRLIMLYEDKIDDSVTDILRKYVKDIIKVRMEPTNFFSYLVLLYMFLIKRIPYHSAKARLSIENNKILEYINIPNTIIYSNTSHFWYIDKSYPQNWIVDQHNNDIEFWRIRRSEYRNPFKKLAAHINYINVKQYFKKAYKEFRYVVAVCEEDAQLMKIISPETKVIIIENGVDCAYFSPKRHNRADNYIQLLFTGTSDPRNTKALDYFLKNIFPSILDEHPRTKLLVAGRFDRNKLKNRNCPNVYFTGPIEDIRNAYDESDIFINPYFSETYGSKLKVAQALAMGICIVTTREGARGFKLIDNETAFIANNKNEFKNKLLYAISNIERSRSIGFNGRQYALEKLDWHILGDKLLQFINHLDI